MAAGSEDAPLIGLTVEVLEAPCYEGRRRYQLFTDYTPCLRREGALCVLLPGDATPAERRRLVAQLDGLLLTGGDDPDLRLLGGPAPEPGCKPVPPAQQEALLDLVALAEGEGLPLLGVCLGMQILGLAHGAGYLQRLEPAAAHGGGVRHPIRPLPGTLLAGILGTAPVTVRSFHHQGLADPGSELRPAARADDGLLEAVELPGHPFALGVQWHPERAPEDAASRALFSAFVAAARTYRGGCRP